MGVVVFVGDHVLECVQVDFIAELVFSREEFVRLVDAIVDVVGEAGLQLFRCCISVRLRMTYTQVWHQ